MLLKHAGLTPVALDNPISKLSADHFSIIVKFLELADIQSARLASRGLHFFLSPYLIKSVRFAAQGDQLALLAKISQNGVFRHSVRTLRYDINLHELPVSTWNELDDAGFQVKPRCTLGDIYGHPPVQPYHVPLWKDCPPATLEESANFEAEQTLINTHLEVHLCHFLESFPEISTVVFINSSTNQWGGLNNHFEPDEFYARQMIRPYQFLSLINAIKRSGCRITKIDVEAPWVFADREWFHDWDFQGLQPPSPHTSRDPRVYDYWRLKKPLIRSCTFNHSPESLSAIKFVFSNLTHLSLVIFPVNARAKYNNWMSPDSLPSFYWSRLPEVLQSLQNVTHFWLDLELSRLNYNYLPVKHCDSIAELFHLSLVTLPRLTSLSLANLQTCAPSLLLLLQRHPAIQDLSLRQVIEMKPIPLWISQFPSRISAPGWFEVTEAMRALRLQRLELSSVEGLTSMSMLVPWYNGPNDPEAELREAKVYAYIQHGYGPNPFGPDRDKMDSWDAELW